MYQLIYLSHASDDFDPYGDKGIQSILQTASMTNSMNDITGMLIYRNHIFLQLLEGEEEQVKELYEKIKSDSRHKDIQTILEQDTDKRVFPTWSMAYSDLEGREIDLVNEVMPWDKIVSDYKAGKHIENKKILSIFLRFKYNEAA